jgi:hypothetical protein
MHPTRNVALVRQVFDFGRFKLQGVWPDDVHGRFISAHTACLDPRTSWVAEQDIVDATPATQYTWALLKTVGSLLTHQPSSSKGTDPDALQALDSKHLEGR